MDTGTGDAATNQNQTGCYRRGKRMKPWWLAWVLVVLIMSGCTMIGPDYVKPEAPLLEDWAETQDPSLKTGEADYGKWWRVFGDPVLDNLVEKAYRQNLSLQIAAIRIYEARAQLGIAVGNLYPQKQSAVGDLTNNRLSKSDDSPFSDDFN